MGSIQRSNLMDKNSVTFSDLEHHLPPDSPRNYVSHDQHLQKQLGDGTIKSIKKEVEGMVRLYENVESKLDNDAQEALLEQLVSQIEELDHFEDEVAAIEASHYQE